MTWGYDAFNCSPEIEYAKEIANAFPDFSAALLSDEVSIQRCKSDRRGGKLQVEILDAAWFRPMIQATSKDVMKSDFEFWFINKFLVRDRKQAIPEGANKLRVTPEVFKQLVELFSIPPAFVHILCRHFLPAGRSLRIRNLSGAAPNKYDYWYCLPIRIQVKCTDRRQGHANSTAGSNQMNPFHYLHLPNVEVDIRGSSIALFSKYDLKSGTCAFVVFNLMDGRWATAVEEPQTRIMESLQQAAETKESKSMCFPHLIYLTTICRWWANALHSINEQLIAYEQSLQQELDSDDNSTSFYSELNRALHSVAAHLHRYDSELNSIKHTVADLHEKVATLENDHHETNHNHVLVFTGLDHVSSQFNAIHDFEHELEKKLANILALLFNRMQITNAQAMNNVLVAMQADMKASQAISEEMKKDSLSMKTIAIVTMFFLPGATYAALLSMPFFENSEWMNDASKFWLWIVLTVPSTSLVFAFYLYYNRKSNSASRSKEYEAEAKIA